MIIVAKADISYYFCKRYIVFAKIDQCHWVNGVFKQKMPNFNGSGKRNILDVQYRYFECSYCCTLDKQVQIHNITINIMHVLYNILNNAV